MNKAKRLIGFKKKYDSVKSLFDYYSLLNLENMINTVLQINIIHLPVTMNRKKITTSQIKFLVVTIKQGIKLVL